MKIERVSDKAARRFRMRIMHISDTHGTLPTLYGRFDLVLHSGDLFPNSHHRAEGNKNREMAFQLQWLRDTIPEFKKQLRGHPFLYVPGNHDFLHPDLMEYEMRSEGIEAIGLTNKITSYHNVNFYGFPYVPFIDGSWNYECQIPEMQVEVDKMVEQLNSTFVDVMTCHSPPFKSLDLTIGNEIIGSTVIANALDYKINKEMMPPTYLCGHVHEAAGITVRNGVLISNMATNQTIIEI
jgi:Icc-related predicted phosphoesterase